jgi:hypothetical protein
MNLSVGERYVLLDVLPKEGTYTTLRVVNKLREALSFSEEEIKTYQITETPMPGGAVAVKWDVRASDADIVIGEKATDLIVESLKKLDKEGKLTNREFSVYEKFIPEV